MLVYQFFNKPAFSSFLPLRTRSADGASQEPFRGLATWSYCNHARILDLPMSMNPKKKAVDRIKRIEEAIVKGREYLESGKHASWSGFRPIFYGKARNGKYLPPHKDWVKNVFLRRQERALLQAQKAFEKLD